MKVEEGAKVVVEDDMLTGDCIMNYKTVASFGSDEVIMQEQSNETLKKRVASDKTARKGGFLYGFSQFAMNLYFAGIFYAGTLIIGWDDSIEGKNIFLALFTIMFGAFAVGQASQFGPDIPSAKLAGARIFEIIKEPSQINAIEEFIPPVNDFKGEIVFRDVWFRYPTTNSNWVFRGLNLTIS